MPGESPSSASLLSCLTMRVLVEVVLERSKKGLRQKSLEDTSVKECLPTPVQSLIDAYLHALEPLHSHFYGIYIYGSIALGGFEELESDIDIVALTHGEWTIMELAQLEALHTQLIRTHQLGKRLEVLYIPLHDLGKRDREIKPYPRMRWGKFFPVGYGDLNYVTWWTVKNKGIRLLGPERSELPFEVAWQNVLETMRDNLNGYWASQARRPWRFLHNHELEYAVTTHCRMLTTIEEEEIITKSLALKRWRGRLPARWCPLIDEAWRIRHHLGRSSLYRTRLRRMREVLAFMKYVRKREGKVLEDLLRKGDVKQCTASSHSWTTNIIDWLKTSGPSWRGSAQ